jgi:hypothetical protein
LTRAARTLVSSSTDQGSKQFDVVASSDSNLPTQVPKINVAFGLSSRMGRRASDSWRIEGDERLFAAQGALAAVVTL